LVRTISSGIVPPERTSRTVNQRGVSTSDAFARELGRAGERLGRTERRFSSEPSSRTETGPSVSANAKSALAAPHESAKPKLAVSLAPNPFNLDGGVKQRVLTPEAPIADTRTEPERFNDAYWAHLPPEVRALKDIPTTLERENRAAALAKAGYTIDVPIQVVGWDPWKVMNLREQYGMQFAPSALMSPGPLGRETPGAIRVSVKVADYPPYAANTTTAPQTRV
jgi:hypothetical protein